MMRLLRFMRPYRVQLGIVFGLVFLQSLSDLYLPTLLAKIVDNGIVKGDTPYIYRIGGQMLLIALGGTICALIASYFSAHIAVGFGRIIRGKLFTHVEHFSLHEFDTVGTASLITRTTNDTNQVQQVLIIILRMVISAPLMVIGGIILAVRQDATLAWVLVGVMPILIVSIFLIMSRAIPLFRIMQKKIDKINLVLDEGLTGVRVIRAFDRQDHERQRFAVANQDLTDTAISVNRVIAAMMPIMMLVLNIATIAIIWFGSIRINNGDMQIGALIAFLQYAMQILFALLMVSMMFIILPRAAASADRINAVLDMDPEIKDAPDATTVTTHQGTVEFDDVTFHYPGAEEPAIAHVSFAAKPGEVTAIIGGTGAGKSTLISLIPRFYDVDGGAIRIDGVDIRAMTQATLRAKIGFVPQKAVLFTGSVADNIRYGKAGATEDEVALAAQVAQATEFIAELPDQFDAPIAQGGLNVSGGQKQRLSIARALVRRPEIYIFDDSFSALDFKTDAKLRAALKRETTTSTVFIVAQRVSTVMDADQILVMDDGKLIGIGNHRSLMETCAAYKEIVASQLAEEVLA